DVVELRILLDRGDDADRDRQRQRQRVGREHQDGRVRQPLTDQLQRGLVAEVGSPQVEVDYVAQPDQILDGCGLVEAVVGEDPGSVCGGQIGPVEQLSPGVDRLQLEDHEQQD